MSNTKSWNPWVLIIFPVIWVIFQTGTFRMILAEAAGGAFVILLVPLAIGAIIYSIKKIRGQVYFNFIKHVFWGTVLVFSISILSVMKDDKKSFNSSVNNEGIKTISIAERDIEIAKLLRSCDNNNYRDCGRVAFLLKLQKNYHEAFRLYSKACENNDLGSCNSLGWLYIRGEGVQKDLTKAKKIFKDLCYNKSGDGSFARLGCKHYEVFKNGM